MHMVHVHLHASLHCFLTVAHAILHTNTHAYPHSSVVVCHIAAQLDDLCHLYWVLCNTEKYSTARLCDRCHQAADAGSISVQLDCLTTGSKHLPDTK